MTSKRSDGQTFLGCWCADELVRRIDSVRKGSMSQFVRDAIHERLIREGLIVPPSEARPVGQAHYGAARFDGMMLNEGAAASNEKKGGLK